MMKITCHLRRKMARKTDRWRKNMMIVEVREPLVLSYLRGSVDSKRLTIFLLK